MKINGSMNKDKRIFQHYCYLMLQRNEYLTVRSALAYKQTRVYYFSNLFMQSIKHTPMFLRNIAIHSLLQTIARGQEKNYFRHANRLLADAHLSRRERLSSQFGGDIWSALRVPQPLFTFQTRISVTNQQLLKFLIMMS